MINLLTPEQQKEILAEYQKRRRIVASFLALGACGLALALLGVLFFQLQAAKREVATALALAKASTKPDRTNELALKEADRTLTIARSVTRTPLLAWWGAVLEAQPAGLTITDWQWLTGEASSPAHLSLAGRADERQTLLDFIATLKQDETFSAVESPISNIIKNNNLDFTIELTLKPNEK